MKIILTATLTAWLAIASQAPSPTPPSGAISVEILHKYLAQSKAAEILQSIIQATEMKQIENRAQYEQALRSVARETEAMQKICGAAKMLLQFDLKTGEPSCAPLPTK